MSLEATIIRSGLPANRRAIQAVGGDGDGQDARSGVAMLDERHLYLQRMLQAAGFAVQAEQRGAGQQARAQLGIHFDVAQGRFPAVVPVQRQLRPRAAVVDAQDDHRLGQRRPAVTLAGAASRIHIARMGSEQAEYLPPACPRRQQLLHESLQNFFIGRIKVAGHGGAADHVSLLGHQPAAICRSRTTIFPALNTVRTGLMPG
jgi:hypothetical protein